MTTKQKQCLLMYLGYYEGKIDGDFGNASKGATMELIHVAPTVKTVLDSVGFSKILNLH